MNSFAAADRHRCRDRRLERRHRTRHGQRHPRARHGRVQKANSGHPGMPMGMADVATVLFNRFITHRPVEARLAGPRPLRALGRARLDAAIRAASPARLPGHADRASCSASASSAAARPAIPSTATRSASRRRPGRSARASPRPSAWRSPSACWRRASATNSSTTTPMSSPATAACRKGSATRRSTLPAICGSSRLIVLWDDNSISIDGPTSLCHLDGPAGAFRGRRLERRCRSTAMTRKPSPRRSRQRSVSDRPTLIACRTIDRQGRAQSAGLGKDAWRAARRGRDRRRQAQYRLAAPALRSARRDRRGLARSRRTRQGGAPRLGAAARGNRRSARHSRPRSPATLPDAVFEAIEAFRKEHFEKATDGRHPQGVGNGAGRRSTPRRT